MATPITIEEFLRHAHVDYETVPHAPAFTAQEAAQVTGRLAREDELQRPVVGRFGQQR